MSDVTIYDYTKKALSGVAEGTYQALLETAVNITAQAKPLAPKKTGNLRGSVQWKTSKQSGGNEGNETLRASAGKGAIVGTPVGYGVYQEFGTRKISAHPFLRPAVDIVINKSSFVSAVATAMQNSVKKDMPK